MYYEHLPEQLAEEIAMLTRDHPVAYQDDSEYLQSLMLPSEDHTLDRVRRRDKYFWDNVSTTAVDSYSKSEDGAFEGYVPYAEPVAGYANEPASSAEPVTGYVTEPTYAEPFTGYVTEPATYAEPIPGHATEAATCAEPNAGYTTGPATCREFDGYQYPCDALPFANEYQDYPFSYDPPVYYPQAGPSSSGSSPSAFQPQEMYTPYPYTPDQGSSISCGNLATQMYFQCMPPSAFPPQPPLMMNPYITNMPMYYGVEPANPSEEPAQISMDPPPVDPNSVPPHPVQMLRSSYPRSSLKRKFQPHEELNGRPIFRPGNVALQSIIEVLPHVPEERIYGFENDESRLITCRIPGCNATMNASRDAIKTHFESNNTHTADALAQMLDDHGRPIVGISALVHYTALSWGLESIECSFCGKLQSRVDAYWRHVKTCKWALEYTSSTPAQAAVSGWGEVRVPRATMGAVVPPKRLRVRKTKGKKAASVGAETVPVMAPVLVPAHVAGPSQPQTPISIIAMSQTQPISPQKRKRASKRQKITR